MGLSLRRTLPLVEWAMAIVMTLIAISLHVTVLTHAGPLWRDEISSLRLATMPTFGGFWSSLVYDPVPALFFLVLRVWNALGGGGSDESLRVLGFLIGLAILAAVWVVAWTFKKSPPGWALVLFALSPVCLVWGDSLRAYGVSCFWNILAIAAFSKLLTEKPRPRDVALAGVAAILSVQSLFPNSFLLFAACLGGMTVACRRRWWKTAWTIFLIGLVSALSLLPYAGVIQRTQNWSVLCQTDHGYRWILDNLFHAIAAGGNFGATLWIAAFVLGCVALALVVIKPRYLGATAAEQNLVLFAGVFMLGSLATTVWFFETVGWTTSIWYYLPLMASAAVALEAIGILYQRSLIARSVSALLILTAAVAITPSAYQTAAVRRTNVDIMAGALSTLGQEADLIVVDNFFYALSFQRYYHGRSPWLGVPQVEDLTLHRWDLVKTELTRPHPIEAVLDRIDQTLRAGHTVYVVGFNPVNRSTVLPPDLPPAPAGHWGWRLGPYIVRWACQIAFTAQTHAQHCGMIKVPYKQATDDVETVSVIAVRGWKPTLALSAP
jgi:hypothetical protein